MDRMDRIRQAKLDPLVGKCRFQHTRASHDGEWAPDLLIEGMPFSWWARMIELSETMRIDPWDGLIEIIFFGLEALEAHYGIVDPERQWPEADLIRADAATLAVKLDTHKARIKQPQHAESVRRQRLLQDAMRAAEEYIMKLDEGQAVRTLFELGFRPEGNQS